MNTEQNMSEQDILELLEEFFQSNYSIKDFCFVKGTIQESTLTELIRKHYPDKEVPEDNPFLGINIVKDERKAAGRPKKNPPVEAGMLFARIGDIELFHYVPSDYLKSLKS